MDTYEKVQLHFVSGNIYPPEATIWESGQAVYEFPFIEQLNSGKFNVHIQRHHPLDPFTLAEKTYWSFNHLKDAYRKWDNLRNGIF